MKKQKLITLSKLAIIGLCLFFLLITLSGVNTEEKQSELTIQKQSVTIFKQDTNSTTKMLMPSLEEHKTTLQAIRMHNTLRSLPNYRQSNWYKDERALSVNTSIPGNEKGSKEVNIKRLIRTWEQEYQLGRDLNQE